MEDSGQIERARHLAHCFYNPRLVELCRQEGIDELSMAEGFRLAGIDKSVRYELMGVYGNPAYGSWPAQADAMRAKRFDELNRADIERRKAAMVAAISEDLGLTDEDFRDTRWPWDLR